MKKFFTLFLMFFSIFIIAQENQFGIKFSGYVKSDYFVDTRINNVYPREGHFFLYPSNISKDSAGKDINEKINMNMLAIQTRLKGDVKGPDFLNAKTSGTIEAEFFGHSDADINGLRLRHAFMKLKWEKFEILAGQYWHPMFSVDCYAGTVSFNTGTPIQPFSRNPQLRLSFNLTKSFTVLAIASSERDFTSTGPDGASSKYLRNSGRPMGHLQLQLKPDGTENVFGIGVDVKAINPEDVTYKIYKTDKSLISKSALAYAKIKTKPVTIKFYTSYVENGFNLMQIGGYACVDTTNLVTGERDYENIRTGSAWLDISSNTKKFQYGIFAGFSRNLGLENKTDGIKYYSRGSNIDYIYRISPRFVYNLNNFSIGAEIEHTVAAYGTSGTQAIVGNAEEVANDRLIISLTYKF